MPGGPEYRLGFWEKVCRLRGAVLLLLTGHPLYKDLSWATIRGSSAIHNHFVGHRLL